MTADATTKTWLDLVNEVAAEFDVSLTESEANGVLWGYTGFPIFWTGDAEACARTQLADYFEKRGRGFVPCARCGEDATSWVCDPCEEALLDDAP